MQIHGLLKTTLLDYPGHLACTIFTGGCNFRCPFCHNKNLVLFPQNEEAIPLEQFYEFLGKRKTILEGVCITGGEPTLHHKELQALMAKIKDFDLKVKLDTNGYRPEVIKDLYQQHLFDYIAMDIKSTKEKYAEASGLKDIDLSKIEESIQFIMSNVEHYEFRTTVVKELHTKKDIEDIRKWIKGCKLYRLQSFQSNDNVIFPIFSSYTDDEFKSLEE